MADMQHKCEKCSKTFTAKKNLYQHVRVVHEEQKLHKCGICQKTFARKSHKEMHLKTCSMKVNGGALSVKTYKDVPNLQFSPVRRKSAFGGCFADWKIHFPEDYNLVAPITLLSAAVKAMKDIIYKHLYEHTKTLKFTMSIHVVFEQAKDPEVKTVPPVVLTTSPYSVYVATDLDTCLDDAAHELYRLIEEYEGYGSGWVIDYLDRLDTNITSFKFGN